MRKVDRSLSRPELVRRVREQLTRSSAPRLQLFLIVSLAGLAAFLSSVIALRLGLGSMAVRYPLATACGYLAFFVLIRWWIAWQRRSEALGHVLDAVGDVVSNFDVGTVRLPGPRPAAPELFGAGKSGGAGGGASWSTSSPLSSSSGSSKNSGLSLDLDLDDLWWLVLALACALGAVLALGYVIYAAPVLLAEVALDAAVVSTLYTRLKKQDVSHWTISVLKHTWLPALLLVLFTAGGGYALDQVSPDARSIGGVIRALSE